MVAIVGQAAGAELLAVAHNETRSVAVRGGGGVAGAGGGRSAAGLGGLAGGVPGDAPVARGAAGGGGVARFCGWMIICGRFWPDAAPSAARREAQICRPLLLTPSAFPLSTAAGGRWGPGAKSRRDVRATGDNDNGLDPGADDDIDVVGGGGAGSGARGLDERWRGKPGGVVVLGEAAGIKANRWLGREEAGRVELDVGARAVVVRAPISRGVPLWNGPGGAGLVPEGRRWTGKTGRQALEPGELQRGNKKRWLRDVMAPDGSRTINARGCGAGPSTLTS
jgi:hypothetical protein